MRLFIASLVLALGVAACGSYGGGSQPAGGGGAPQATNAPQPANATSTPSPRKTDMGDDPYGYGY